jgi:DNA-binding MarR family transcriptional regulator
MSARGRGETGGADASGVLAHLWQLIQAVMDDAAPALEAVGLSPKAFFLLAEVEGHPFPAELARRMHLPPPTVTYLVKQLEEKGFLERRAEPGDLRKFRLVTTAAGRKAIRRGRAALGDALGERLRRLDRGEVDAFDRVVRRLGEGWAGGA